MKANDIVERLRASELPGERQTKREARMELGGLLDEAAAEIERLRELLRELDGEMESIGYSGVYKWRVRIAHALEGVGA